MIFVTISDKISVLASEIYQTDLEDTVKEEFSANQWEGEEKTHFFASICYRSVRVVVDIGKVYSSHKETYYLDKTRNNIDSLRDLSLDSRPI